MRQRGFLLFTLTAAILLVGILAAPAPARATDDNYSYARIVRLSYVSGDVQIIRPGESSKWEPAFANMPIQQGFTVGTNNGRAEIEFEQGSAVWLSENSVLQFTELALSDGGRITKMTLAQGTASFEAGIQTGDTFAVTTSQFQIAPVGKSGFRVDAFTSGGSVNVFAGSTSISSSGGTQVVAKGETFTLNASAPPKATITSNPSRDNWDRWVSNRENYLVNGANQTLQNTASPYTYGAADLSAYGAWNYDASCGFGWQPYGVSKGWMPFLNGQWMFYPSLGWTWVSFEQWGWMPYHFGGWSNCGGSGWMWMPGENGFWNAGPVQWVGGGGRLGWKPLPPRNPRVNAPHPAAVNVVFATRSLNKEGRYEVKSASPIANSLHEFSTAPLANGKMPTAENSLLEKSSGAGGAEYVLVPTAANLAMLRSWMFGGGLPPRTIMNGGTPPAAPRPAGAPVAFPATTLMNAAPPLAKIPAPPPVRTIAFAPSQPGQASARGSSSASMSGSGRAWGGSSTSSSASSSSRSSGSSASSSAPSSSASGSGGGGGGRPH